MTNKVPTITKATPPSDGLASSVHDSLQEIAKTLQDIRRVSVRVVSNVRGTVEEEPVMLSIYEGHTLLYVLEQLQDLSHDILGKIKVIDTNIGSHPAYEEEP